MTREELEMRKLVRESDFIDRLDESELAEAFNYLWEKYVEQEPCDVFDEYGNYKYPSDVELTEPNTATSMPCQDAVSREAVLDLCDSKDPDYKVIHFKEDVECLPPVYSQPKTGHWIDKKSMNVNNLQHSFERFNTSANVLRGTGEPSISIDFTLWELEDMAELLHEKISSVNPQSNTGHWIFDDECKEHGHCSQCGYGSVDLVNGDSHNFCRNCGAKMSEIPTGSEGSNKE